jgi:hypothetical protein
MLSYTAGHAETTTMFPFWEATTLWRSAVVYAECAVLGTCQTSQRGIEALRTMLVNTSLALYRFVAVSLRKRRGRIKERPERWRCEKGRPVEGWVSKNARERRQADRDYSNGLFDTSVGPVAGVSRLSQKREDTVGQHLI